MQARLQQAPRAPAHLRGSQHCAHVERGGAGDLVERLLLVKRLQKAGRRRGRSNARRTQGCGGGWALRIGDADRGGGCITGLR
jgi:hypothetical protein